MRGIANVTDPAAHLVNMMHERHGANFLVYWGPGRLGARCPGWRVCRPNEVDHIACLRRQDWRILGQYTRDVPLHDLDEDMQWFERNVVGVKR